MKPLEELRQEINQAPTIMSIELEHEFCRQLVQFDVQAINGKWKVLFDILGRLHESHCDTIYNVRREDDFSYFVTWANNLAKCTDNSNHAEGLTDIAAMFDAKL